MDLENNRQYCAAEGKAEERQNTKDCQSFLYRTLDDPVALFTAALTFATVALFGVTAGLFFYAARQAREARAAVDLAKENAVAQLRAYVFTGAAHGTLPEGENGRFAVSVEVRNCGATPAHGVRMWLGVWISDYPEPGGPFQPPAAGFQITSSVMPPAGTYRMTQRTKEPIADWLPWLRASTNAIYAYGRIDYADVFGNRQWTMFRLVCAGEHVFGDGAFQLCLEGNDASRNEAG